MQRTTVVAQMAVLVAPFHGCSVGEGEFIVHERHRGSEPSAVHDATPVADAQDASDNDRAEVNTEQTAAAGKELKLVIFKVGAHDSMLAVFPTAKTMLINQGKPPALPGRLPGFDSSGSRHGISGL